MPMDGVQLFEAINCYEICGTTTNMCLSNCFKWGINTQNGRVNVVEFSCFQTQYYF